MARHIFFCVPCGLRLARHQPRPEQVSTVLDHAHGHASVLLQQPQVRGLEVAAPSPAEHATVHKRSALQHTLRRSWAGPRFLGPC